MAVEQPLYKNITNQKHEKPLLAIIHLLLTYVFLSRIKTHCFVIIQATKIN